ncbi:hypothetical protein DFS34DRAFT_646489 [Phlyctochytrium arcticum]|nr:hypothetical protein DFS34DRAFT_646489 [Phlyctochytrium arcticum]
MSIWRKPIPEAMPGPEAAVSSEIKKDLCNSLKLIGAPGTFAAFKDIPICSIGPVSVRDVGIIPFPLGEDYARKLIDKARLAPFGKGAETVVDTSIRNTWELDASQLDFTGNQKWVKTLSAASAWVAKELAISGAVRVEPYKMLIYEEGAMFKPHTDTEKIPGMFGTLVIALPSGHTGGDLFVKHRGEGMVFKTSTAQPCMLCWYSDVSHEVLPVTSGYRWVLTFNLATSATVLGPSFDLPPGLDDIQKALRKWLEFRKCDEWDGSLYSPYYILEHSYTEANISLNALKGVDRLRMQALKRACEAENVSLYFGIVEKSETGSCEEDYYPSRYNRYNYDDPSWHAFIEVYESNYSVQKLVTTDGQLVLQNVNPLWVDISGSNSMQNFKNPLDGFARGEEDYSGYTGNEGVTATHWYRATVAIIVPTDFVDAFLETIEIEGYEDAPDEMRDALELCDDDETRDHAFNTVHCLAKALFNPMLHNHSDLALEVLEVSLRHRQYQLFNCIMKWLSNDGKYKIPAVTIFSMVKRTVTEGGSFDLHALRTGRLLTMWMKCDWEERMKLLSAIAPLQEREPQICAWITTDVFAEVIRACEVGRATEAVGTSISTLVTQYENIKCFEKRIVPLIQAKATYTPFAMAAVLIVMHHTTPDGYNQEECVKLCKPLLKFIIEAMDVTSLCSDSLATPQHASDKDDQKIISIAILVECIVQCHRLQWDDLSTLICNKIAEKANIIPSVQLRDLWIPFLQSLIPALLAEKVPLSTQMYRHLGVALLEACLYFFVGQEPSGQANYQQSPVGCKCADCNLLDAFLNSNERVWRFRAAQQRRQHLEHLLRQKGAACSLATDKIGSPQTLVVTKGLDAGTKAKNAWTDRFNAAWTLIRKFDQAQLNELLGGEYDRLVSMRDLRYRHVPTHNAEADSSPRGVKRKEL